MTRDARVFRKIARHCGVARVGENRADDQKAYFVRLPTKFVAKTWATREGEFGRLARAWLAGKLTARSTRGENFLDSGGPNSG